MEPGSNIVMAGPIEIREIMAETGLPFEEVAEPFPDIIREGDREYTLEWAIIREEGRCRFFLNGLCSIYKVRPWICRTYPFMLENGRVIVFPCNGTGTESLISADFPQIHHLAMDLVNRHKAEKEEEERVAGVLAGVSIPAGQFVVIDGEGMRIINE
jgi:Fe-S-cluster containining protein